ncbi:MAG TPA: hypothetical protein DDZ67_03715 [Xanthomonadaceae bacterium]|nr:hypothetical protein [Xanthomonadaceae bacterium]
MPLRHFVHVIGFQVPTAPGQTASDDNPLLVMLDREPTPEWRAVFQLCVEELPESLIQVPPKLHGKEIRVVPSAPVTRKTAADIRAFIDRVNRMTFLQSGSPRPRTTP